MTADFNRWAGTPTASVVSTFSAFPFANLIAMLVGGVMTAALAVPNANPFGADNMFGYLNGKQMTWLSGLAFLFLYVNLDRSARIASIMRQPAGRASSATTCA